MNRHEALGRYTEAAERFETALQKRNDQLEDIAGLCNSTAGRHQTRFCFEEIRLMIDVAEQLEVDVIAAVAEANAVAVKAGKPAIKLWEVE